MGIWSAGSAERANAYRAAKWGGIACLILAGLMTIVTIVALIVEPRGLVRAAANFVGASLIPMMLAIAGKRLLRGEGLIWGSLAVVTVALDLFFYFPEPSSLQAITAAAVRMALLAMMINGVRGALAIRNADHAMASPK